MSFVVRFNRVICGGEKVFRLYLINISKHRCHFFDFYLLNFDLLS